MAPVPVNLLQTITYNYLHAYGYNPLPLAQVQAYLRKNLRISCLAAPSSSHAFANSTFSFSALLLTSCPFSLRHRSIVCRTSIPTASRVPVGISPFLCRGLRPSPLLTWKSSKAAWRFSVTCEAAAGWSPRIGQQIL
jgi:hypothetical protein